MIYLFALVAHIFGSCTEYATRDEEKGFCCVCGKPIEEG
jgi:hypothetical protein